jgi:anti-sigma regulatory factor (Ser/Thr protein kinase)
VVTDQRGYQHEALCFSSDDELVATLVPFLVEDLDPADTAMVVCTPRTRSVLRAALGDDTRIRYSDSAVVYRRTPQAILAFKEMIEERVAAGAPRARVVGEVEFGRTPAEWIEWVRFEAVINHALAPYPVTGLCIYDTRRLAPEVVATAPRTHPTLWSGGTRVPSSSYVEPRELLDELPAPGPDPLEVTAPVFADSEVTDLRALRRALHEALGVSTLPAATVNEFTFAVSEVVTNAVRHGDPPVSVLAWADADRLLCAVTDQGKGIDNPFAGYVPAHSDPARGGLGLWLARRLCDHVELERSPAGFTVRLSTGPGRPDSGS